MTAMIQDPSIVTLATVGGATSAKLILQKVLPKKFKALEVDTELWVGAILAADIAYTALSMLTGQEFPGVALAFACCVITKGWLLSPAFDKKDFVMDAIKYVSVASIIHVITRTLVSARVASISGTQDI